MIEHRFVKVILAAAGLFLTSSLATLHAADAPKLAKVVLVMRHGIRPPTKSPEDLAPFASQPWPAWPVAPGELTPHGAANVTLMGRYLRDTFVKRGLLASTACESADAFVWADSADQRTRASGDALMQGLSPCGGKARHLADGTIDPLFHPDDAGVCKVDGAAAVKAVNAQMDINAPGGAYEAARKTLQNILAPKADCSASTEGTCALAGRNTITGGKKGLRLDGPLNTGGTMAENFLLEYEQGFSGAQLGWGRLDATNLAAVMPMHALFSDVTRSAGPIARVNAALLARKIADILNGAPMTGDLSPANTAKVAGFLGHDTNLSNLAGFFDVHWTLRDQPDETAPDTAMVFELWRKADGTSFVDVKVVYQRLEDLRRETPLTAAHPAGAVDLTLPACGGGRCTLAAFKTAVDRAAAPECRAAER